MTVRLVSATLVLDELRLLGTFQYHDDRDGEPTLRQVNVTQTDTPPGYVLTDTNGDELTVRDDAVRWEANRVVRVLILPAEEVAKRAATARAVVRSGFLERGRNDDLLWQTMLWRFARGEITKQELDTFAAITTRQVPASEAVWEPAPGDTLPEQWWQAAQHRFRQSVLDSTVSVSEAAALLDCTVPDVDELLGTERLVDILLDRADPKSEQRIPRWQFRSAPGEGERFELLPGLGVVIAAAPRALNDGRTLTRFMTTPHDNLVLQDKTVTPAVWLASDEPLEDVVGLLTWRRR